MVTYRATLDVPREVVLFLSRLLAAERALRGTRRALTCFHQAVMALRHFRDGTDPATLAHDHGIGRSTGYRYIDEATAVLSDQAPDLYHALQAAYESGVPYLVLDGKVIPTDRCSQKTTSVKGKCVDLGYEDAGIGVITPIKQPNQGPPPALDNRTLNKLQRGVRCLGERGFALLTQRWRLLHITAGPARSGISPEPLLFSRTSNTGA